MNPVSEDIKDMLVAQSSLGLEFASNLFIGKEPNDPKNCVTIFDTMGFPLEIGLSSIGYEYPSIQIRVRNKSYLNGMQMIENIKDLLHGQAQETWNGTLYSVIMCSGGPALLDWDDNGNCRLIINFNVQRRSI